MSQAGQHSPEPAQFGLGARYLASHDVAKVCERELPRIQEAGFGRDSSLTSSSDFGSSLVGRVLQSPRGIGELGIGKGKIGWTGSVTRKQSTAGDIDGFLSGTKDVPDTFLSFVSFNRSEDVTLPRGRGFFDVGPHGGDLAPSISRCKRALRNLGRSPAEISKGCARSALDVSISPSAPVSCRTDLFGHSFEFFELGQARPINQIRPLR